jgi:large conductance mechanosensitive channel
MWKDFKAFIMRGNVLDLAVAVVIGAAFSGIVKSLVDDVIMPPIGLILGKVDFSNLFVVLRAGPKAPPPYTTPAIAKEAGAVTLNYGMFINNVIAFLIVAAAVFMIVRVVSHWYAKPAPATPTTKPCPMCTLSIPLGAKRCPNCTAELAFLPAESR